MQCKGYEGALSAFRSGFQANCDIFTEITQLLTVISSSFDSFLGAVPSIDVELPTKRRRSSLFVRLSGMVDFPNAEKRFSEIWKWAFGEISNLPTFGGAFVSHFLPIFNEIRNSYETEFHNLEERYSKLLTAIHDEESSYEDARKKYNHFCQSLESKHNSRNSDFSTAKSAYPSALDDVLSSLKHLNDTKLKCGIELEKCLLEFETIDRTRNEAIDSLLKNMSGVLSEYREHYVELLNGIRTRVDEISSQSDVEDSIDMLGRADQVERVDIDIPGFDFTVTEFLDVNKAFEDDLRKWKGKITETTCDGQLKAGEFVTVFEENPPVCSVETATGVMEVELAKLERVFKRQLARVNEEYDVLNPGEIVLAIDEVDSKLVVMNVFGTKFTLEKDKVTFV